MLQKQNVLDIHAHFILFYFHNCVDTNIVYATNLQHMNRIKKGELGDYNLNYMRMWYTVKK